MPHFSHTLGQRRYVFDELTSLLAKASPLKSGDQLAGIAATSDEERVATRLALADVILARSSRSTARIRRRASRPRARAKVTLHARGGRDFLRDLRTISGISRQT